VDRVCQISAFPRRTKRLSEPPYLGQMSLASRAPTDPSSRQVAATNARPCPDPRTQPRDGREPSTDHEPRRLPPRCESASSYSTLVPSTIRCARHIPATSPAHAGPTRVASARRATERRDISRDLTSELTGAQGTGAPRARTHLCVRVEQPVRQRWPNVLQ
jgi:hypothetical protein